MQEHNKEDFKALLEETSKSIEIAEDNFEINRIIENLITSLLNAEYASLWLFDVKNASLNREKKNDIDRLSMLSQKGVVAKSFFTLENAIYNYVASEKEYDFDADNPDNIRIKSMLIFPLMENEQLIGMLTVYCSVKHKKSFSRQDINKLEVLKACLIEVLYKMHPSLLEGEGEQNYIGERLGKSAKVIVTEIEEIEEIEEIDKIEKVKEDNKYDKVLGFVAKTVHDIRTPANSLYGFLELLEGELENPRLLKYLQNAKESAVYINDLTTSILDSISVQEECSQILATKINPRQFFSQIITNFSANMYNKNITFNAYLDPCLPQEISIKSIVLKRILMNLLSNAYKFTPSDESITISVIYKKEEKRLEISVKDTGIGIPKERQEEIFKPYIQAEEDTKEAYGGTGLGLCISADYVKYLGGHLHLKSKIDEGSIFTFDIVLEGEIKEEVFLPISNKDINLCILSSDKNSLSLENLNKNIIAMGVEKAKITYIQEGNAIPSDITHLICFQNKYGIHTLTAIKKHAIKLLIIEESFLSLTKKGNETLNIVSQYTYYARDVYEFLSNTVALKVLIVDDDMINVKLIRAILENHHCTIDVAIDGEMGLNMLVDSTKEENEVYDLVYLDHHMPKETGLEVVKAFRTIEKEKKLRPTFIVSISGNTEKEENEAQYFNLYLGKPFNKEKIKASFRQAVNYPTLKGEAS